MRARIKAFINEDYEEYEKELMEIWGDEDSR